MSPTRPQVRLTAHGKRRVRRSSHPWLFRDHVADAGASGHGDLVELVGPDGKRLDFGFLSLHSKIAVRRLFVGSAAPDPELWRHRVDEALAYRERVGVTGSARRVLFGESDGLPGLVADLYGAHLVVQVGTAGGARILKEVSSHLVGRLGASSILARNDAASRRLEGLPREVTQLQGETPPEIEISMNDIEMQIDPWRGQKTGAFLDQAENYRRVAALAKGRVLDVFSYQGGFALQAAARADRVEAVESSVDAARRGEANVALNRLANVTFRTENAFGDLRRRERRGERWDMVILDPPAFAKSRADLAGARRGYREINLRAMRLLESGGLLVTCSCSYNLAERDFLDLLRDAAIDAGRSFRIVARGTQAGDHPLRLGFPESGYLKCLILSVL